MSDEIGGKIKALVFDVFGTVVDWRSSITREIKSVGKRLGVEANWETFADRWRAGYHDGMQAFRVELLIRGEASLGGFVGIIIAKEYTSI